MTRSRLVVLSALIVVGVGVVGALGALYFDPARAAVGPLPAEGLALPGDTQFVMGFDVHRFVASPFYQRFGKDRQGQGRPPGFTELEEKTGLNPERDVDRILFAGRGVEKGPEGGVLLVSGRFDRTKLSRAIETETKGVTSKSHEGTTVYLFREEVGKKTGAAAFLDDDTLVLGPRESVEATITNYAGGKAPMRSNAALVALLESVKPGSTFWAVGDQSVLSRLPLSIPGATGQGAISLPPVKSVVVTGDLDPMVAVELTGEAVDGKAAQNLADIVRGFVALASLQASQRPELKELASAVSVTTDAARVHVNLRVPYELIDSLSGKRPMAANGAPESR
ncbi:MAG: hypothetical protein DMF83_07635 [Acidobacteria bacterium]|nr:MAG: hypothetical protein DMF83_07635 [Acidobacteriota bacterium]